MIKLNNKDNEVFIVKFESFPSVSITDFKQVHA